MDKKAAIRMPDDSVIFVTANSTRDLIPMQPNGFSVPGDGVHHHVSVVHIPHPDVYRVGEYAFSRAQAELLFARLLTLLYGAP